MSTGYMYSPFVEKRRGNMMAAVLAACLVSFAALALWGCGGGGGELRESLIEFSLRSIIPSQAQQGFQLVKLQRYPLDEESSLEGSAYERYWKIEGGAFTEIDGEEYERLRDEKIKNVQGAWQASEHSVVIRELNEKDEKAALEVDTLYGPLSGEGTVYYLERQEGSWKIMEKATAWVS